MEDFGKQSIRVNEGFSYSDNDDAQRICSNNSDTQRILILKEFWYSKDCDTRRIPILEINVKSFVDYSYASLVGAFEPLFSLAEKSTGFALGSLAEIQKILKTALQTFKDLKIEEPSACELKPPANLKILGAHKTRPRNNVDHHNSKKKKKLTRDIIINHLKKKNFWTYINFF